MKRFKKLTVRFLSICLKKPRKARNLPEKHFLETKRLATGLSSDDLGSWLLDHGYFPENYVLPPSFRTRAFSLLPNANYKPDAGGKFYPPEAEPLEISFPKSLLTVRTYGILDPALYHDLALEIVKNWKSICKVLFSDELRIFSYSFPIPITSKNPFKISELRAGRMIYEFLEMAENALVSEAHRFSYLVKADISSFYPSIYTHTISWALHGKVIARQKANRNNYSFFGNRIDRLLQAANDGSTNGIPIGSVMSDLIAEILLSYVDSNISREFELTGKKFVAVRFKDDYRILCKDRESGAEFVRILQKHLGDVNLTLSEPKTTIKELPEGLYREWTTHYAKISLKGRSGFGFKTFESRLLSVLDIDRSFPGTGLIDRFLVDLSTRKGKLKIKLKREEKTKFLSLLLMLKRRRPKSFPKILGVVEQVLLQVDDQDFRTALTEIILELLNEKSLNEEENEYEIVWLLYFCRKVLGIRYKTKKYKNPFIESLRTDQQKFFKSFTGGSFYVPLAEIDKSINENLKLFGIATTS